MRHETTEPKLSMMPMIDVTFLLLIFFMCTIKFKTLEGKLQAYLPKDEGSGSSIEPVDRVPVRAVLIAEGVQTDLRSWEGRRIGYRIGPRAVSLEALETELRRQDASRGARVTVDEGVHVEEALPILDALISADFTDVSFAL